MTAKPQPADLLALADKVCEHARFSLTIRGVNKRDEELLTLGKQLQATISSLAAHRGEVEPVAWQRRIRGDSGKWLGWEEYHDGGSGFPSKLGRWDAEYRQLYTHPPQAQAGAGDAWLPIETAPLGPRILVTGTEIGTCVASAGWDSETPQNIRWEVVNNIVVHPTKWQPLPAPRALEAKP